MRLLSVLAFAALTPFAAVADEAAKQAECQFQGDLMGAVQQARKDRVAKDEAVQVIRAANPEWPAAVDKALPPLVDYVYSLKRRDIRKLDLAADTQATCLANYDQIQALKESIKN